MRLTCFSGKIALKNEPLFLSYTGIAIQGKTSDSEPLIIKETGKVANLEKLINGNWTLRIVS